MTDLFEIPEPEAGDHAGHSDRMNAKMPPSLAFATKGCSQCYRCQLVRRTAGNRQEEPEQPGVGERNQVRVGMGQGQQIGLYGKEQRSCK